MTRQRALLRALPKPARTHWIRLRAVAHPTEELERVRDAVRFVSGLEPEAFDAEAKLTPMETHHGGRLQVVELLLDRSKAVRALQQRILDLPGARETLGKSLDARTDDDGIVYLRLEKQDAYQGRLVLTTGEDCVQVRLKFETYPATREAAMEAMKALLASQKA